MLVIICLTLLKRNHEKWQAAGLLDIYLEKELIFKLLYLAIKLFLKSLSSFQINKILTLLFALFLP